MIRESLGSDDEDIMDTFSFKELTLLAVATSIDAFAVGITFALLNMSLFASMYNNRNCGIYIQYCRYFHWKKTWKLFRRQI